MTLDNCIALLQALAYVVLAGVAVVGLKRASATLLQPLRTEVFKAQLAELRALLQLLVEKDETELRDTMGFGELLYANAVRVHDHFFRDVYGVTVDEAERPYSQSNCPLWLVHEAFLAQRIEGSGHFFRSQWVGVASPRPEPSDDAREWWQSFRLDKLCLPRTLVLFEKRLRAARTSPLLPEAVASRLDELLATMRGNTELLGEVLGVVGRALPAKHASARPPATIDVASVADVYYAQFVALSPRVAVLIRSIRDYLGTDKLWKPW